MSHHRDWFETFKKIEPRNIGIADNNTLTVTRIEEIKLDLLVNNKKDIVMAKNVLFVPGLATNLISINKLTKIGYNVTFTSTHSQVIDVNGALIATAKKIRGTYRLDIYIGSISAHNPNAKQAKEGKRKPLA